MGEFYLGNRLLLASPAYLQWKWVINAHARKNIFSYFMIDQASRDLEWSLSVARDLETAERAFKLEPNKWFCLTLLRRENKLPDDFRSLYEFVRMMDPALRSRVPNLAAWEAWLDKYSLGNNEVLGWALDTFITPALAKFAQDVFLASTMSPPRASA